MSVQYKKGADLVVGDVVVVWFGRPTAELIKILPYAGDIDFARGVGVFKTTDGSSLEMTLENSAQFKVVTEPKPSASEELWDADPNCTHDVQAQPRGGVKCTKCAGWFCF